jgi:hypothetical protein
LSGGTEVILETHYGAIKLTICLVLRKPFISLSRMLLWPEVYHLSDTTHAKPGKTHVQKSLAELEAAKCAVTVVLQHNSITVESIQPRDLKDCEWLAENGPMWLEPGTETIEIPDIREEFRHYDA